jgi:hypothetical protein
LGGFVSGDLFRRGVEGSIFGPGGWPNLAMVPYANLIGAWEIFKQSGNPRDPATIEQIRQTLLNKGNQ